MKIQNSFSNTTNPNTLAGRFKTTCVMRLLPLLLLLTLPAVVRAQFTFTTNNDGSLNISQYTGSDGAVTIPSTTNGLPVTSIGNYAFELHTSVTSIIIPDTSPASGILCLLIAPV